MMMFQNTTSKSPVEDSSGEYIRLPIGQAFDTADLHELLKSNELLSRKERKLRFSLSGIIMLSIILLVALYTQRPSDLQCAKQLSSWSNMWDAVEFYEGDFDNAFAHPSIYRGPPTPEREYAWDRLWNYGTIAVSAEGIAALNKTHRGPHVTIKSDADDEEPKYGALVEVFHQLHCLNLIRQYTWLSHYNINDTSLIYPYSLHEPVEARMHVDHCFESLRLSLMCYADVTPVLVEIDETIKLGRRADFSVHHKCRDFDKVTEWMVDHAKHLNVDDSQYQPEKNWKDVLKNGGGHEGHF
ncbi:oxidase ustYa family protein [Aspergillus ibericus CBS 121593]|uniref:Tat pathway signal sequence n=1 Tax=Aspergillus ibericus CBS 121593 TaxID=1448316 RepID=A0A395HAE4_9EURO|nr:hypothetical protein BO80DRAFT_499171 [Aspergillus ibericus CBS 121593]RAL04921.1 hypothetical protein BO80DRAFT_499171 [Aspergillus ibericus CBS 121593]